MRSPRLLARLCKMKGDKRTKRESLAKTAIGHKTTTAMELTLDSLGGGIIVDSLGGDFSLDMIGGQLLELVLSLVENGSETLVGDLVDVVLGMEHGRRDIRDWRSR